MVSVKGVSELATPSAEYKESSSSEKPFHFSPGSGSVITNLHAPGSHLQPGPLVIKSLRVGTLTYQQLINLSTELRRNNQNDEFLQLLP